MSRYTITEGANGLLHVIDTEKDELLIRTAKINAEGLVVTPGIEELVRLANESDLQNQLKYRRQPSTPGDPSR